MSSAPGSGSSSGSTTTAQDASNSSPDTSPQASGSGSGSDSGAGTGGGGGCTNYNTYVAFGQTGPADVAEEDDCNPTSYTVPIYVDYPGNCPVSVDWYTLDGTATAGTDYIAERDTASFAAGASGSVYITIPILDDGNDESVGSDYFKVILANPVNATLGAEYFVTVNIEEGPQQAPTDTLRWAPCMGNNASTVQNWWDVTQGFRLQAGAPGLKLNPPIQFDNNPNDAVNNAPISNAPITWDQNSTVASITLSQYTGQQSIKAGIGVESKGANDTALSMDGSSWLKLNFGDSKSVFQVDNNATITNMVLAGNYQAWFQISGGTTTIAGASNYQESTGVNIVIFAGATLQDNSYTTLTFTNNELDINIQGTMKVFYGTGTGAPLIDSGAYSDDLIYVNSGTLVYNGSGGVTDTFNVPVWVHGGIFTVQVAGGAYYGGKLIVKGGNTNTNNNSVYQDGSGEVQLLDQDTLECDNDYRQDGGALETLGTAACTLQDGTSSVPGTANINGGFVSPGGGSGGSVGELDVNCNTLNFGATYYADVVGNQQGPGSCDLLKVNGNINISQTSSSLQADSIGTLVGGNSWVILHANNQLTNYFAIDNLSQTGLHESLNKPNNGDYLLSY